MTRPSFVSPTADVPIPSAVEMQRRMFTELSPGARAGYTMLLLVGLSGAGVVGSLLATEPVLPLRTQIAFVLLTGVGLAWAAFALWALTRRHVLLAAHGVVATRMAVSFTTLFTLAAFVLGQRGDVGRAWFGAVATGLAMLAVALVLFVRARRRYVALTERRAALERQLATGGEGGR